ncbi:threonine ammonia-lyase [Aggregicoccus sp. 17bor-14]|nr:threonine ammonia-lyase [Simulacricoccus sp. 17bor-14]MRI90410.1 threonine ammonia-lyase [Aggregicoccus sp. 17bor-14]
MVTLHDIRTAQERISGAVPRTPCPRSDQFSDLTDAGELYCKLENLHRTGAFKERGALNKLLTLSAEERARGVIAASAGNHAQGVAYHSGRLGIGATIVMPEQTPLIKVTRTREYGARVVLHGANFDEAYAEALRLQRAEGRVFVHPFDDDLIIAGQGTVGLELLEQVPGLELVVVPIGGGGLISGIACALKETNPAIQVVGVQTAALPSMKASWDAKSLVTVPASSTIADGIAVKRPGERTFELVRRYVDDVVTVDEEELSNAILLLLEREKSVVEGAGAAGLAALIHGKVPQARGKRTALVLSGGNIDVNLLSRIIERGLLKDGRKVRLVVRVPDRPGNLAKLTGAIAELGANVMEIHHSRSSTKVGLGEAEVEATLETRGRPHIEELKSTLAQRGWRVTEEG